MPGIIMRTILGYLLGAATTILMWRYGAAAVGRILAVPGDVDYRRVPVLHTCEHCGSEYTSPLAAALCCDPAAFGEDD